MRNLKVIKSSFFDKFIIFSATFIACFITLYMTISGFSAVFSSSIVTLIIVSFSILFKNKGFLSDSAFCGSFAGMTSISILNSSSILFSIILLSVIIGFIYTIIRTLSFKYGKYFFNGFGGKLGTTAFISVIIFMFIKDKNVITAIEIGNPFNIFTFIIMFITALGAGLTVFFTKYLTTKYSSQSHNYKIFSPAFLGLIGYFVFLYSNQEIFSLAFYAGTFAGMTAPEILSKKEVIIAGFLTGLFLILGNNMFVGIGGKLGFFAFLSVYFIVKLTKINFCKERF